ncbi:Protein of unknown function [Lactobacillus helveticus CIRM-BIA 104]|uniref:Uncharacterized protein n=1 Tax=Lactobacillus helveticus CIRM-BIA 104 TaxID=1226333 RepID=U6F8U7_LACHE|nr:Protein of unknown function [Lactobacillus helveticus CIRM-BIA 104]CDI63352.1 Protein of unknown function [Lactobacillus helveticus CIRM-BIA 103]
MIMVAGWPISLGSIVVSPGLVSGV